MLPFLIHGLISSWVLGAHNKCTHLAYGAASTLHFSQSCISKSQFREAGRRLCPFALTLRRRSRFGRAGREDFSIQIVVERPRSRIRGRALPHGGRIGVDVGFWISVCAVTANMGKRW
ncbi:hypothetical protein RchiOBHm_Chr2g0094311 [Rosa chinensis]|uniref:Secreted protein n=1 Tax=Rosa chinensis TaxID=74649 RepID=A0A2P6RKJ0_ROSCH|nr:hypothetical protein RchiOBHm_Chr2g0094311 [Rosa chinensis]